MKKTNVTSSRLRLSEIIRWVLAGIFICLSFIYVGMVALWGIGLTLLMLVLCFCNFTESDEQILIYDDMADIALVNGLFFMLFGSYGFLAALWICIAYVVISLLIYQRLSMLIANMIFLVSGSFLFDMNTSVTTRDTKIYVTTKYETAFEKDLKQFAQYGSSFDKIIQNSDVLPDSQKVHVSNPYSVLPLFEKISSLQHQKMAQLSAQTDSLEKLSDETTKAFLAQKKADFAPILSRYMDRSETVRIKRLWQNSDVLPWTYEAYTQIFWNVRSGRWFHSASLSMSGDASFQGENKLDYVNVIFSNNIYRRYLIKDNPEWLLVKEGDEVAMNYEYSKIGLNLALCKKFGISDFDILFKMNFVPLYKK